MISGHLRQLEADISMTPNKIMLIRHAEKPIAGRVEGFRARGEKDDASLTARGWQRAGALTRFFDKPRSSHIARRIQSSFSPDPATAFSGSGGAV
jgi:hypothetical protein